MKLWQVFFIDVVNYFSSVWCFVFVLDYINDGVQDIFGFFEVQLGWLIMVLVDMYRNIECGFIG